MELLGNGTKSIPQIKSRRDGRDLSLANRTIPSTVQCKCKNDCESDIFKAMLLSGKQGLF